MNILKISPNKIQEVLYIENFQEFKEKYNINGSCTSPFIANNDFYSIYYDNRSVDKLNLIGYYLSNLNECKCGYCYKHVINGNIFIVHSPPQIKFNNEEIKIILNLYDKGKLEHEKYNINNNNNSVKKMINKKTNI